MKMMQSIPKAQTGEKADSSRSQKFGEKNIVRWIFTKPWGHFKNIPSNDLMQILHFIIENAKDAQRN